MDYANRLDIAMRAKGFRDQKHLARESGVPASTINRILSGRNKTVSIDHGYRLAKACGVSLHWLACGEEDPNKDMWVKIELINNQEYKLLKIFRHCNPDGKTAILIAADAALSTCPKQQKE